jgi:hypothetical protein
MGIDICSIISIMRIMDEALGDDAPIAGRALERYRPVFPIPP